MCRLPQQWAVRFGSDAQWAEPARINFYEPKQKNNTQQNAVFFVLAAELGFEPRQTESESVVLPLHNSAMFSTDGIYYTTTGTVCQEVFAI